MCFKSLRNFRKLEKTHLLIVCWVVFPVTFRQVLVILNKDNHEDDTAEDVSDDVDDDDRDDDPALRLEARGHRDGLGELHQQGDARGHAVQEGETVHC